jgi:hypothetical protein
MLGRGHAGHRDARRRHLLQRHVQRGLGVVDGAARMRHVFARDHMVGRQRRAARQVFLGALQGDAALVDHGVQLLDVRIALALLAHGRAQARLGLGQVHFGVGRIEADDLGAGLDQLGLVGADLDHAAGHLRGHVDEVAAHVGVVGLDALGGDQQVVGAIGRAGGEEGDGDAGQDDAALAFVRDLIGIGAHGLGFLDSI